METRAWRESAERRPLLAYNNLAPSVSRPRYQRTFISRVLRFTLGSMLFYFFLTLFIFPHISYYATDSIATSGHSKWLNGRVPLEELENIMLSTPQEDQAREYSRYYTSGPHLGGMNLSQAIWTKERWEEFGIPDVEIVSYDMYTNYPKSHRLALLASNTDNYTPRFKLDAQEYVVAPSEVIEGQSYKLLYEANLSEDVLDEDPTTGLKDRIPTFHGYSANGNVTAEFVYANYATYQDFEDLISHGVNITGKVVLCRYGYIFRGLKVKRAEDLGAVGVIMYSDPGDDGEMTELNGYKPYPNGPARNPSSVQRGSVQYLSLIAGDPTTPGYASKPGVPRQDPSGFNPTIPSLPISYADALPLLRALNGHGLNATDLGEHWSTGGLYFKDVKYNIGPAPGIVVNLVNEVDYVITPHWNVIGEIKGYIPDETVILGNHRDAWVAGGAADPNSGTAAFLEMARSFGKMLQIGWKPARTIILASWDGEEYALLGSTEWVEDHHAWLSTSALAYINVDVGTVTPHFEVSANPLLNDIVRAAASRVPDPNSLRDGKSNVSIADVWGGEISTLGSGSDYTAFQDYLGIPSVDMGFGGSKTKSPVYHYHSNYDSFHWMEKFGDPSFRYHVAMSKIWGLIALNLAETPIIPFNTTAYADGLANYLADIQSLLKKTKDEPEDTQSKEKSKDKHMDKINPKSKGKYRVKGHRHHHHHRHKGSRSHEPLKLVLRHRLHHLRSAIHHLHRKTKEFEQRAAALALQLEHIDKFPWWKRALLFLRARAVNQTYKRFDRCFLHAPGLDGRSLFKHVVFAPGKWTGYSGDRLPGLVESVREGDWANAIKWSSIIEKSVKLALKGL